MHRPFLSILLVFYSSLVSAQLFPATSYPQKEFRNPLGIPIKLAANFGELRANHYHMGLDIRTEHRENLPVYAAADGQVCRIKIEPFGFGQAVYIRHTNGLVTLYAHLNRFYPALAAYIKQKQYESERWDMSLEIPPGLFRVKQGDLIAYSGNMGGSQGPHLHFEIRTYPEDVNLNPMLFGMPVADDQAPVFRSLSVYDRNQSFYEQRPHFTAVKKSGSHYEITMPVWILNTANPGFGVQAFDTQSGSSNPNGIFQGLLFDNETVLSGFQMDRISYDETRGINAHIDYPTHEQGGPYYQLLFRMPGYHPSIYRETTPGAAIHLEDGLVHEIKIEIKDAKGNASSLVFRVRYQPVPKAKPFFSGKIFYPGLVDGYEDSHAAFYLGATCLYDSLHVPFQEMAEEEPGLLSSRFQIGQVEVPLADTMTVRIKPNKPVEKKDRVLMEWRDKNDFEDKKPQWLGDWATASFRSFGTFYLVLDTVAPVIQFPGISEGANLQQSSRIQVVVSDNYKKIKNFRATLDGKWLLFSHDKEKAYLYYFDDHCPAGSHELKIYAEDEAGNPASALLHFKR
jgi:murein DD-endopeptidase MepM/ murein hydrolase activator NlpD